MKAILVLLVTTLVSSLSFAAVICEQPQLGTLAISTRASACYVTLIQSGQAWHSESCSQVWDGEKMTILAKLNGQNVPFQPTLKVIRTTSLNVTYAALFTDGATPVTFQGSFSCKFE